MAIRPFLYLAAWCGCVVLGLGVLSGYDLTPALTRPATGQWPDSTTLARDATRPTLLVFVHPRCPCSRASLAELDRLAASSRERALIQIIFVRPEGVAAGWERTPLWTMAEKIPGASICADFDGLEAARFRTTTSGEALLYNASGKLLFQGGLTAARGHEGPSPGTAALSALIHDHQGQAQASAVYGCALASPSR